MTAHPEVILRVPGKKSRSEKLHVVAGKRVG